MAVAQTDFAGGPQRVAAIVDARLPAEPARAFKLALLQLGHEIASASGGFFGFGAKVGTQEKAALAAVAVCPGIVET